MKKSYLVGPAMMLALLTLFASPPAAQSQARSDGPAASLSHSIAKGREVGPRATSAPSSLAATSSPLEWNTFLGGTSDDSGDAVAVDNAGNVYVAGDSEAAWGSDIYGGGGNADTFVAKFKPDGTRLWNTFMGGLSDDLPHAIAVDGSGNVYVAGESDIGWGTTPTRPFSIGPDAFVAKLNSSGTVLWYTFLGGSGMDYGYGIALDQSGNIYVVGMSTSEWSSPLNHFAGGSTDAFVARLRPIDGVMLWNTFLGGSGMDYGYGIAVDPNGDLYVGGEADASWGNPTRKFAGGASDSWVAKLHANAALVWNTFLGGGGLDNLRGIALGSVGSVYVVGHSNQTWGAPTRLYGGYYDAYAAKVNGSDGSLLWNTFLGSGNLDQGLGIATDALGNAYITGESDGAWGSPIVSFTPVVGAFVAKVSSTGALVWNAFLGGGMDYGTGVAADAAGDVFVTGVSRTTWGNPILPYHLLKDGFVAALRDPSLSRALLPMVSR